MFFADVYSVLSGHCEYWRCFVCPCVRAYARACVYLVGFFSPCVMRLPHGTKRCVRLCVCLYFCFCVVLSKCKIQQVLSRVDVDMRMIDIS